MSIFRLDNKVAAVTGGGSGIGEAISLLFAKQGAHVCILDYNPNNAQKVAEQIKSEGGKADVFIGDVSNHQAVKDTFDQVVATAGKLDILVNNAGISQIGSIETTSEEDLDKIYAINIKGVYNCLKFGVEKMKANGGGAIVNMASIASHIGLKDRFGYSMTKGAVLTMTYSVADDLIDQNIRCNCISPARVHTPFVDDFIKRTYPGKEAEVFEKLSASQPIGRMGQPDEVATLALYLCADESGFVTGTAFGIDGGTVTLR